MASARRGRGGPTLSDSDDDYVDYVDLRVAARSGRKSAGRLSSLIRQSVSLVWASGRVLFIALLGLQVLVALALAGQVLAVQAVLDAILELDERETVASALWLAVIALAGLTAVTAIATAIQANLQRLLGERVARTMWHKVLDVATSVPLRHFESSEFFNRLQRVESNALSRPYQVTQGLITMAGALAASIGVGAVLVSISPLLLPLLVIGGVPVLLTSRRESRLEFEFSVAQTPVLRLREYLALIQTGRDEAKEVRAFGLAGWLRERFDRAYSQHLGDLTSHVKRRSLLSVVGNVGTSLVLMLTLAVLVWMIVQGRVTVAGAGAAIVAIRMLAGQVQALFAGVQRIFESGLFLDDLSDFLRHRDRAVRDEDRPSAPAGFDAIRADGVTFRYPGQDRDAVHAVDLTLRAGEVVAIVGENGSGKTTLSKLVAGLYEPDDGTIRWDGTDVREWSATSLRSRISVIFQDYVRYALTALDNVAIGRVSEPPDEERAWDAVRAAGAGRAIESLPGGFSTPLSRMFAGGRELSGGQWQRVAIARGFYRDAPLVILDEPSAALDPRAEHDLFASLRDQLAGRTVLFISHRFSTVRSADRIYVMDEGKVVEHGSHDELMARAGLYAELFTLQAAAYLSVNDGEE